MKRLNEHLATYGRLVVRLHRLTEQGQGSSDAALAVLEQMDGPESRLSPAEIRYMNGLSGDLYMTMDHETTDRRLAGRFTAEQVSGELANAVSAERWDNVLLPLRTGLAVLDPDRVAYLRSRAYEADGHVEAAIAFMDEAARRRPSNANYRALSLELLVGAGMYAEATRRAAAALNDSTTPARLVVMAAGVVCRLIRAGRDDADLAALARLAAERLTPALRKAEAMPAVRFVGLAALAMLRRYAGDGRAAVDALDEATAVEDVSPDYSGLIVLATRVRDLLHQGSAGSAEEEDAADSLMAALPVRLAA